MSKTIYFDEIEPPEHKFMTAKQKKVIFLSSVIVLASVITIPLVVMYFMKTEEKAVAFVDLQLVSTSFENTEGSSTFLLKLNYQNEYDASFVIEKVSLNVSIKPNFPNSNWIYCLSSETNKSWNLLVDREGKYNLSTYFTVKDSDVQSKILFEKILMKCNDSVRFSGKIQLKMGSKDGEVPDMIEFDFQEQMDKLFDYTVPNSGPSIFTIYDIHSLGDNLVNPEKFDLKVDARYDNPLNFSVSILETSMSVTDRTAEKIYGEFVISNIGEVNGKKNITFNQVLVMDPVEIAVIVSDLINQSTDVFYMRDISTTFEIGYIKIIGNRSDEIVATDLKFEFKLDGMRPALNGNLITNFILVVPCNLTFNVSYVFLNLFVAGTKNLVVTIDQLIDTGTGKLLCLPYTANKIKDIELNVKYDVFLQHVNDNFDLTGYIFADCYNFNGRINIGAHDVELM